MPVWLLNCLHTVMQLAIFVWAMQTGPHWVAIPAWVLVASLAGWGFERIPARCPACRRVRSYRTSVQPVTYVCRECSHCVKTHVNLEGD